MKEPGNDRETHFLSAFIGVHRRPKLLLFWARAAAYDLTGRQLDAQTDDEAVAVDEAGVAFQRCGN